MLGLSEMTDVVFENMLTIEIDALNKGDSENSLETRNVVIVPNSDGDTSSPASSVAENVS
jgi:hypothetical protein